MCSLAGQSLSVPSLLCLSAVCTFHFRHQFCVKLRCMLGSSWTSLEDQSQWRSAEGSVTTLRSEPTASSQKSELLQWFLWSFFLTEAWSLRFYHECLDILRWVRHQHVGFLCTWKDKKNWHLCIYNGAKTHLLPQTSIISAFLSTCLFVAKFGRENG